jgi:hypothetical protein
MQTGHWRELEDLIVLPFEDIKWLPHGSEAKWRSAFRRTIVMDAYDKIRLDEDAFARFQTWFEKDQPVATTSVRTHHQTDLNNVTIIQAGGLNALNPTAQFLAD